MCYIRFYRHIDTQSIKRPCGFLRLCTHCGFWPYFSRPKSRFYAGRPRRRALFRTMGYAGDCERGVSYSKEVGVFSFAMVIIEVHYGWPTVCRAPAYFRFALTQIFTGAIPFHPHLPGGVVLVIVTRKRPPRPIHEALTDELWISI